MTPARGHLHWREVGALPAIAPMPAATTIRTLLAHVTTVTSDYTAVAPPTIASTRKDHP